MAEYRLTYWSALEEEEQFLDDLVGIFLAEGIDERLGHGLTLAFSEAFSNALVHGNGLCPEKRVQVAVSVGPEEIRAEIVDEGTGGLKRVGESGPPELLSDHGRGLSIMEHFAREVEFSEAPGGGLKVSLCFDRKLERIGK